MRILYCLMSVTMLMPAALIDSGRVESPSYSGISLLDVSIGSTAGDYQLNFTVGGGMISSCLTNVNGLGCALNSTTFLNAGNSISNDVSSGLGTATIGSTFYDPVQMVGPALNPGTILNMSTGSFAMPGAGVHTMPFSFGAALRVANSYSLGNVNYVLNESAFGQGMVTFRVVDATSNGLPNGNFLIQGPAVWTFTPEPSAYLMSGGALVLLGLVRRRKGAQPAKGIGPCASVGPARDAG